MFFGQLFISASIHIVCKQTQENRLSPESSETRCGKNYSSPDAIFANNLMGLERQKELK